MCNTSIYNQNTACDPNASSQICSDSSGNHYKCSCNTSIYNQNTACDPNASSQICSDSSGTHYKCTCSEADGWYEKCPTGKVPVENTGCNDGTEKHKCASCIVKDCTGFTLTSCPEGQICDKCIKGCGNDTPYYKVKEAVVLRVSGNQNSTIEFDLRGNYTVDWGDGSPKSVGDDHLGTLDDFISHTYTSNQQVFSEITITGNVSAFRIVGSDMNNMQIVSLNLPSLRDASQMFWSVSGILRSNIPNLPPNLENGSAMFKNCSYLVGPIPDFPDSLDLATEMFYNCKKLIGEIPAFPQNFTGGHGMFHGCSGLTGKIPSFPSLLDGRSMFKDCSGLTGNSPALPQRLEPYYTGDMFVGTQVCRTPEWDANVGVELCKGSCEYTLLCDGAGEQGVGEPCTKDGDPKKYYASCQCKINYADTETFWCSVPITDCATLGYTQTTCDNGKIKIACPFDSSKVACIKL